MCHKSPQICSVCRHHNPVLSSFITYHRDCTKSNTTGTTCGAGAAYPSGAPDFFPGFKWGSCCSIFSFISMFCRSLVFLLSFFFWPLRCNNIICVLYCCNAFHNRNVFQIKYRVVRLYVGHAPTFYIYDTLANVT